MNFPSPSDTHLERTVIRKVVFHPRNRPPPARMPLMLSLRVPNERLPQTVLGQYVPMLPNPWLVNEEPVDPSRVLAWAMAPQVFAEEFDRGA